MSGPRRPEPLEIPTEDFSVERLVDETLCAKLCYGEIEYSIYQCRPKPSSSSLQKDRELIGDVIVRSWNHNNDTLCIRKRSDNNPSPLTHPDTVRRPSVTQALTYSQHDHRYSCYLSSLKCLRLRSLFVDFPELDIDSVSSALLGPPAGTFFDRYE